MNRSSNQPPGDCPPFSELQPSPWLTELCAVLFETEPDLWAWFGSKRHVESRQESVRLDLLKTSVPIDPQTDHPFYQSARKAHDALALDVPVTIYQTRPESQFKVSIFPVEDRAQLVVQGTRDSQFDTLELDAVFGHELGKLVLWNWDDGDFLVVSDLVTTVGQDPGALPIQQETLRLYQLYTEIFCDRCAMIVQGHFDPVISSRIKIDTGRLSVETGDLLKSATAMFLDYKDESIPKGISRAVCVRTRALDLWRDHPQQCESEIANMVLGPLLLDRLDAVRQHQARYVLSDLINLVLAPDWMKSKLTLAHVGLFSDEFAIQSSENKHLLQALEQAGDEFRRLVCCVMLDFVSVDRDLQDPALAHTLELSESLGIKPMYVELARKELRLRKKQVEQIEQQADKLVEQAARRLAHGTSSDGARAGAGDDAS